MSDFWYACDPDWDEALGPMSRPVLDRLLAARRFPRTVLIWHPDHAEWLPGYSGAALAVTGAQAVPSEAPPVTLAKPVPASTARAQGPKPGKSAGKPQPKTAATPPKPRRPAPPIPVQEPAATAADQKANQAFALVALRRLGARTIDVLLVMPVLAALFVAWSRNSGAGPGPEFATDATANAISLTWIGLVMAIPVEALMLAVFGTTPGKALFGLQVRAESGSNPDLFTALGRQFSIFVRGFALGIPVLNMIAVLAAGVQTLNDKRAPWDRKRQLVVDAAPLGGTRLQFAIVALVLTLAFVGNDGADAAMNWFIARWFQ